MPNSAVFDLQILANVLLIADNKEQHVLCWNNSRIQCWTWACALSLLYLHSPPCATASHTGQFVKAGSYCTMRIMPGLERSQSPFKAAPRA